MSIKSTAFGCVTLTQKDAKKFRNQVLYGSTSASASESVKRGIALSREVRSSGHVTIKIASPEKERKSA